MADWTKERIERLSPGEVRSLRQNALERGALEVVALCDQVSKSRPLTHESKRRPMKQLKQHANRVPKVKAMEMRGVKLRNIRWSWGAIRESDGLPVMTIWEDEIDRVDDKCEFLLWGPNTDGSRPWADTLGGRERHEHCRVAARLGEGEGVLIYGARRGRDLPADKASQVEGADPYTVIRFQVQVRSDDYWAVWNPAAVTKLTPEASEDNASAPAAP